MNKKQAIQAMLDGKKVKHSEFDTNQYFQFNNFSDLIDEEGEEYSLTEMLQGDYQLYQEPPKTETINVIKFISSKGKILEIDQRNLSKRPSRIIEEYIIDIPVVED